jgi:2-polyprenyl-3-methyl-5-hydroxy-6-metoxy-1,4-benzoquinol methylase
MGLYYRTDNRIAEFRIGATTKSSWTDYFIDSKLSATRSSAQKKLRDAEKGIMPEPYGKILDSLPLQDSKILDLGCGVGIYVLALQRRHYDVEGIDYSEELVSAAKKNYPELKIFYQDATKTHYEDESFDIILSLGVVEHSESGPELFLKEIHRLLKNKGKLLISVPFFNLLWKLRMIISNPFNPDKLKRESSHFYQYRFTRNEFILLLRNAGFKVLSHGDAGSIKALEDAFPVIRSFFSLKGGYRFRKHVVSPLLERFPGSGHMLWMVVEKI